MISECTVTCTYANNGYYPSATDNVRTCPHCGNFIDTLTTSFDTNTGPYRPTDFDIDNPFPTYIDRNDSYTPSCGHWPHQLHEKRIKQRSKPVHQFVKRPIFHRKCFMQLKTFKNLRFHA